MIRSDGNDRATREDWPTILETAPEAFVAVDGDGRIELFNPVAERLFGFSVDEVLGRKMRVLASSLASGLAVRRPESMPGWFEVEGRRRDGSRFPLDCLPWCAPRGTQDRSIVMLRDATERLLREAAIESIERRATERARLADLGASMAKVVHDLGNRLWGIELVTARITQETRRDGRTSLVECSERLSEHVDGLHGFVRELLCAAREERPRRHPLCVAELLERTIESWRPVAAQRGIGILLTVEDELPEIEGDGDKLARVLDNLVKNALESMNGRGDVEVELGETSPGTLRIAVADAGTGIPSEVDVFELFRTTKPDGSGLGLPVAREIVEQHGGSLRHEARLGGGTCFVVELPLPAGGGDAVGRSPSPAPRYVVGT